MIVCLIPNKTTDIKCYLINTVLLQVKGVNQATLKMLHLILGSVGTFMSFFGIFTNLYVLVVLLLNKKARSSSEWILLHLSYCGLGASLCNLVFVSPSVFLNRWLTSVVSGCKLVGASILILQLLTVWSICALSVDRCAAIVSPLRYTQVVTRKRIAIFFITVWLVSVATVVAAFFIPTSHNVPEATAIQSSYSVASEKDVGIGSGSGSGEQVSLSHTTSYLNMIIDLEKNTLENGASEQTSASDLLNNISFVDTQTEIDLGVKNSSIDRTSFQYRELMGVCLPKMYQLSWSSFVWVSVWVLLILIAPMTTLLICDFTVLSIARKQRHRIVMALYQITTVTQVTVTGTKGTPLPGLWLNRSVPARSRACRAVWEDMLTLCFLHLPLILILILEIILETHQAPQPLVFIASVSLYATPSLTAVLYGIRARPLRAAYKSYLRKRLTNSTLQHEIQQRLSPVDGSPRPSSRAKSFRSSTPSPNSSPIQTPRRLSTNDLRPPPIQLAMSMSPSHGHLGQNQNGNLRKSFNLDAGLKGTRKVRSFLHIPSQIDMQEFWSGLRRPNRSPTIVITHEIRIKESTSSLFGSQPPTPTAEQRL